MKRLSSTPPARRSLQKSARSHIVNKPRRHRKRDRNERVRISRTKPKIKVPFSSILRDYHHWHLKLNHAHPTKIHHMAKHHLVPNMPRSLLHSPPKLSCSGCAIGKMKAAPFRRHPRSAPVGSHLHTDICGPFPCTSLDGNKYFSTFLDEGSRYLTVHCSPTKSAAASFIKTHIHHTHQHTPHVIRHITSDNAREYYSSDLKRLYAQLDISTHPSIPHTPQENSLAERINRTLLDATRASLLTSGLPHSLFDYALLNATDAYNHTPHTAHGSLPAALWLGTTPDVTTLLPFGTQGYVHDRSPHHKLEPRAILMYYLARQDYRHYFVFNPLKNTVHRCRAADFAEYHPSMDHTRTYFDPHDPSSNTAHPSLPAIHTEPRNLSQARKAPDAHEWELAWNTEINNLESRGILTYVPRTQVPPKTKILPLTTVFKLKRNSDGTPTSRKVSWTIRGDKQVPGVHYDPYNLSSPVTHRDTIRSALALAAANSDHALHWDIEAAFFHEKFNDNRTIFVQQPTRFDGSLRHPHHVAQLTGNMYGSKQACRIFTEGLSTFLESHDFQRLHSDPCSFIRHDPSRSELFILLIITVDDFLVISNSTALISHTKSTLLCKYSVKDLGPVSAILGWKVTQSQSGITISQPGYISSLLEKYRHTTAKPSPSPIASELLAPNNRDSKPLDTSLYDYTGLIGSLRYLADCTRPDISYIVGFLGRYSRCPTTHHWLAALRVLRYLRGTSDVGITYSRKFTSSIVAYSDSDHAACPTTRRSTTGSLIFYNGAPVSWQSKRQRTVSPSTHAAEYVATFHTTQLLRTVANFLTEIQHLPRTPIPLYIDNAAAIATAKASYPTPNARHIDVKYHWLKEQVHNGLIEPIHISSNANPADVLTKTLKPAQFKLKLPLLRLSASTARGD